MSDGKKPAEPTLKEAIAEAISQALPAAVQVAMQAQRATPAAPVEPPVMVDSGSCMECGQPIVKGKYACQQKHQYAVVMPNLNQRYFLGIKINGVTYLSTNGQNVCLPASINVAGHLDAWDKKEQELMNGTKRNVSAAKNDFRHRQRD